MSSARFSSAHRRVLAIAFFLATVMGLSLVPVHAGVAGVAGVVAPAVDVFGLPVAPSPDAASAATPSSNAAMAASPGTPPVSPDPFVMSDGAPAIATALPAPIRRIVGYGIVWQGRLNAAIERAATQLQRHRDPALWWTLVFMSFAYGVLHAIGPGHGKLVVGAYIGSRKARLTHAIALSGWTAAVQALSAIGIVFAAIAVSQHGMMQVLSRAAALETVSYGLLTLAGLWTLWTTLTRRDCCAPTPVRFASLAGRRQDEGEHAEGGRYLGAAFAPRSTGGDSDAQRGYRATSGTLDPSPRISQIFTLGLAAGIRPCVGAIFVLITTIAAGVPGVGIAATLAMSVGVALTVTAIAVGSVGINRLLVARRLRYRQAIDRLQRVVAGIGATVIVLYGMLQVYLLLNGYVTASVT